MDHYDSQMAARVWQRVQGSTAADDPAPDLLVYLQEELTDLSRYHQLSDTLGSAGKPILQQLIQSTRHCISILRGMYRMLTDDVPEGKASPLPKELPVSTLRRAYGSTLQRITSYDHWCNHPEYGPGFLKLAELSRLRCQLLLQLFGSMSAD